MDNKTALNKIKKLTESNSQKIKQFAAANEQTILSNLLETAKFNTSVAEARSVLKTKFQQSMITAHNGSLFTITPERLIALDLIIRTYGKADDNTPITTVLIDEKGMPVRVEDCKRLLAEWLKKWEAGTTEYLAEYGALKTKRTVSSLVK